MFEEMMERLSYERVIPLAAVEDEVKAVLLCKALVRGGIKCVEIAFRTSPSCALDSSLSCDTVRRIASCIASCKKSCPDVLVGAGTVTSPYLAKLAFDAGASFIVSPGFNIETVKWCIAHNLPILPGVCTPSEIEAALSFALNTLKFFPAEVMGGVGWLKAMSGPFSQVRFVATGGVNASNAASYLAASNCIAICTSSIAAKSAIEKDDWAAIENNASSILSLVNVKVC